MKIFKPEREALEEGLAAALEETGKSRSEWLKDVCRNVFECLKKTPMQYRDYGPYWWGCKRALADNVPDFKARTVDAEWLGLMSYGDAALDVHVALEYLGSQELLLHSNYHSLYQMFEDDDGSEYPEPYEYTLIDEEMESLAFLGD